MSKQTLLDQLSFIEIIVTKDDGVKLCNVSSAEARKVFLVLRKIVISASNALFPWRLTESNSALILWFWINNDCHDGNDDLFRDRPERWKVLFPAKGTV